MCEIHIEWNMCLLDQIDRYRSEEKLSERSVVHQTEQSGLIVKLRTRESSMGEGLIVKGYQDRGRKKDRAV